MAGHLVYGCVVVIRSLSFAATNTVGHFKGVLVTWQVWGQLIPSSDGRKQLPQLKHWGSLLHGTVWVESIVLQFVRWPALLLRLVLHMASWSPLHNWHVITAIAAGLTAVECHRRGLHLPFTHSLPSWRAKLDTILDFSHFLYFTGEDTTQTSCRSINTNQPQSTFIFQSTPTQRRKMLDTRRRITRLISSPLYYRLEYKLSRSDL